MKRITPLALVTLFLAFTGCDTIQTVTDSESVDPTVAAKSWFHDQVRDPAARKGANGGIDPTRLLATYFPDWSTGQIVDVPQHPNVLVVLLGDRARETFGTTKEMVRTLLVTLSETGEVVDGEIVEFVGYREGSTGDVAELVRDFYQHDFGKQLITVVRYDALYQPISARQYLPQASPIDLALEVKECTYEEVNGAGKGAGTTYECYQTGGGGRQCNYWTEDGVQYRECRDDPTIYTCVESGDDSSGDSPNAPDSGTTGSGGNGPEAQWDGDDVDVSGGPLDCTNPSSAQEATYCAAQELIGYRRDRVQFEINLMNSIGGVCSQLADRLTEAMQGNRIRIHTAGQAHRTDSSGQIVRGHPDSYGAGIRRDGVWYFSIRQELTGDRYYTGYFVPNQSYRILLGLALAHEAEHAQFPSAGHLPGHNGALMQNTLHCSGQ